MKNQNLNFPLNGFLFGHYLLSQDKILLSIFVNADVPFLEFLERISEIYMWRFWLILSFMVHEGLISHELGKV